MADLFQNDTERKIIVAALYSDDFLKEVYPFLKGEYFQTRYTRILGQIAQKHYRKYKEAPKDAIETHLLRLRDKDKMTEEDLYVVLTFLEDTEGEREISNVTFMLDETMAYFHKLEMEAQACAILEHLEKGDVSAAQAEMRRTLPNFSGRVGIDPLTDQEAIEQAFLASHKPLFRFDGALGYNLNAQLTRGSFMGILAPEKRGKSWFLQEMAVVAAMQGCKVAMFQAGDMTQPQAMRRLGMRIAKKSYIEKYCKETLVPLVDCVYNQRCTCEHPQRSNCSEECIRLSDGIGDKMREVQEYTEAGYRPCTACFEADPFGFQHAIFYQHKKACRPLSAEECYLRGQQFKKRYGGDFRMATYPSDSLRVSDIEGILDAWEKEDFKADVVLIDYADILLPEASTQEFRHQVNSVWKSLRRLSQERDCFLAVPTQSNAEGHKKSSLGAWNFSEDKRKMSHVTSFIALNQSKDEKRNHMLRVSLLMSRDEESERQQAVCLQHLQTGQAITGSFFWDGKEDEEDGEGKKRKKRKDEFKEEDE